MAEKSKHGNGLAAVLFDLDGVILDSMAQHAAAWQEALAREGLLVSRDFVLQHEGALSWEVLAKLPHDRIAPSRAMQLMASLLQAQQQIFNQRFAHQVQPFEAVGQILDLLNINSVPLALVTSSSRTLVQRFLPQYILDNFAVVVTAEDVTQHKPHPEPYLQAASRLGQAPGDCLVAENAPAGIASAVSAGATCCAIASTLPKNCLTQADWVFNDLHDFRKFLQKLL